MSCHSSALGKKRHDEELRSSSKTAARQKKCYTQCIFILIPIEWGHSKVGDGLRDQWWWMTRRVASVVAWPGRKL